MAIEQSLQAVEDLLRTVTASSVPLLTDTTGHILSAGGKRLRPRLVLLAHAAAGGPLNEDVIPLAAAVEIIHTATLVHDDINDHGTLRRGRETVNARWGGTFALLTGDFMFTKTYEIMAPYPPELNRILAKAAIHLVEGETLQIHAAREGRLDRETYYEIIALKTAALFVACAELGAVSAGAPQEWVSALSDYAYNLGLAFQITDDLLDLIADSDQIGKNVGIDLAQGRGIAAVVENSSSGNSGSGGNNGNGSGAAVQVAAPAVPQDTAPGPLKESFL
ncbi:MAG: polyprenyl synthetase family protein, partial [Chloroflexi bacterium]|nr:polyprenyl synthetase family protein [Chloroflexota bacterium]